MLTTLGFVLIYLGALNSLLATTVETCTMGAADSLSGGIYTVVLYGFGLASLWLARPRRLALLWLLPVMPLIVLHVIFSIRLASGVWLEGLAACSVMQGHDHMFDGREDFYAWLWLAISASILLGLPVVFFRRRQQALKRTAG